MLAILKRRINSEGFFFDYFLTYGIMTYLLNVTMEQGMAKIKIKIKAKSKKTILKKKPTGKKIVKKVVKKTIKKKAIFKTKAVPKQAILKVKDIVISKIMTVDQAMPIIEVAKIMTLNNIGAVVILSPILDAIGIFTERDLLNKVVSKGLSLNRPVLEVMTPGFVCVQLDDEVQDLPSMMMEGNFRHLPVVDGRKVVGMLSIRDIVRVLLVTNNFNGNKVS